MNNEPIPYDYMALFRGLVWLVLLAGLVIVAINFKWWPRGTRYLGEWYRSRRGDVLNMAFLTGTFLLALGYAWLRWILTHTPE